MSKLHKVKSQHWRNNELQTDWDYFDDFESAKIFAESITGVDTVKVYTHTDELVHALTPAVIETYS
jgi:hypothetical protein